MRSTRYSNGKTPRSSPVRLESARGAAALGAWSAAATAATYIIFDLGVLLDPLFSSPWDVWVPIGASALLAPSFVLLTVSVHYSCSAAAKVWTHSAALFAAIYAALAELVYVTWLFVVHPRTMNGTEEEVKLLVFAPGSFTQMVDAAAYTFMGMAIMLTAAVFIGPKARWQRWFALANGPAAILVFISYLTYDMAYGAAAGILVPAYAISVFMWFRRA
ncbi:hypothetical protein FHJ30_12225 [Arthrobacter sp. BB-1]|uniref:hypothetical protein n=1 Tax=unclassified Arthrobacter TaxID=235627 RepID=UPI001112607B|nr:MULTISPECIES: hypothetical protein [unclassified Arthrobacter]TNB71466.1 hypothetical protein FHJ30_12225 [Arthrobacter sp. BB-1]